MPESTVEDNPILFCIYVLKVSLQSKISTEQLESKV